MKEYYIAFFLTVLFGIAAQNSYTRSIYYGVDASKSSEYKLYVGCIITILVFFAGFRYHVGADYGNYMMTYEARKVTWMNFVQSFDEPGFAILCKISSMIYDDYATMFFLTSLIPIYLYVNTIKKYSDTFLLSISLYILVGTWAGAMGAIRQYLAASIIFAGHRYLIDRKPIKYCLVIAFAMLFHRTAIIMIPVYFIANKKIDVKTVFLLILSVIIIRYSYDLVFTRMSGFKGTDQAQYRYMTTEVNPLRVLVNVAPVALYLIADGRKKDKETQFYSMMLFVNAAFMVATSGSAYLARVGIFTETFTVFAFPKLLGCLNGSTKKLLTFLIVILYFVYFTYQIYSSASLNNFQWIFSR